MKNYFKYIFLFLIVMVFSGCVKYTNEMEITNSKKVIYQSKILVLKSKYNNENLILNVDQNVLEKNNINVSTIDEDDYIGYSLKKIYKNIDDIASEDNVSINIGNFINKDFNDSKLFKVKKSFIKNTYTANFIYKIDLDKIYKFEESDDESLETYEYNDNNNIDITFEVNLPSKVINTNATSKMNNDKQLIWDINYETNNEINFEFNIINYKNLFYLILCAVIIVIIIIICLKKTKRNISVNTSDLIYTSDDELNDISLSQESNIIEDEKIENVDIKPFMFISKKTIKEEINIDIVEKKEIDKPNYEDIK